MARCGLSGRSLAATCKASRYGVEGGSVCVGGGGAEARAQTHPRCGEEKDDAFGAETHRVRVPQRHCALARQPCSSHAGCRKGEHCMNAGLALRLFCARTRCSHTSTQPIERLGPSRTTGRPQKICMPAPPCRSASAVRPAMVSDSGANAQTQRTQFNRHRNTDQTESAAAIS